MRVAQDKLTGLYTGSSIVELLDQEIFRVRRFQRPLSIIIINPVLTIEMRQQYLPLALRSAGMILKEQIRTVDLAGLFGDKILLILPETDSEGANILAVKLAKTFELSSYAGIPSLEKEPIKLEFGIASIPKDGENRGELLDKARQFFSKTEKKRKQSRKNLKS